MSGEPQTDLNSATDRRVQEVSLVLNASSNVCNAALQGNAIVAIVARNAPGTLMLRNLAPGLSRSSRPVPVRMVGLWDTALGFVRTGRVA